jgi:NSS family neurotransmitter:Na+ symporter
VSQATATGHSREHWGSRVGLILAMAGNAVGLGNFLRFPVQMANNGGGTFMIPYFISFLLLGIPLMWMEWGIGRYGGSRGFGTIPRMFDGLWKSRAAKYVGVLGLLLPLAIFIYYTVLVGWLLAFAFFSLIGDYFGLDAQGIQQYLYSLQNIHEASIHGGWIGFLFYGITLAMIVWVLSRGISGGIEKLALWGMPILFVFAFVIMIRVLTLPGTELGSPENGLAFTWIPNWSRLGDASVWVAAAGQIFFTLSLAVGSIHTYASYLSKEDDITLTGLATASTNEFAEVVLGGTIAVPAAVTFFGVTGAMAIASQGSFDFGIIAMGAVLSNLPGPQILGQILAFMWYFLLFIAGITSSVALASPAMAFVQEEFGVERARVALGLGGVALLLGFANVWWYREGFLTEWDSMAGTYGLFIFAFIEIWIVRLAFGMDNMWDELHHGADLKIPLIFKFIMKWVAPTFITVLAIWFIATAMLPELLMQNVPADQVGGRWLGRIALILMFAGLALMVHLAWKRNGGRDRVGRADGTLNTEVVR